MNDDVEVIVRNELAAAAQRVEVDAGWSWATLDALGRRRTARRRQTTVVVLAVAGVLAATVIGVRGLSSRAVEPVDHRITTDGMVDIGGRSLEIHCRGVERAGAPTVVLDTDLGGNARAYEAVVRRLADDLRVCTYARAGTGASDAADSFPRTASDIADDLARLVANADLGPRIVLVTEGFTALSGAVFAAEHGDLVTGLVLLDPRGPGVSNGQVAALGEPRPGEARRIADVRSSFVSEADSINGEQISVTRSEAEAWQAGHGSSPAFGGIPVVVLWSGAARAAVPPLPPAMRAAWWDAEIEGRDWFAAESTRAQTVSVPGVEGALASSAPDVVAKAILDVATGD